MLKLGKVGQGLDDYGLEVLCAHAARGVPDPLEQARCPVGVRLSPTPGVLVLAIPGKELGRVLALKPEGLTHRVDERGLLGLAFQLRVCTSLRADELHCCSS